MKGLLSMEYEVKVARSIEEVEGLRSIWEKMQCHPNVDIDFYLTVVDSMADILRPHVILFSKNGQPEAMAVGRLARKNMGISLGYKTLFNFKVPCMTIPYGGLLGNWSKEISHILITELMDLLKRNEADIVWLNLLRTDSQVYELAKKEPSFICRDHVMISNVHHKLTLNIGPYDVISMCDKMMCITKSRCALFVQDDVHCYFNYGDI